jgi:hypothetical protein
MKKTLLFIALATIFILNTSFWGFFAHQRINRLAVFTLPPEMIGFYKKNLQYITDAAVNPDRRRFSDPEEAPRHYIDLDHFGDSAAYKMPRFWSDALIQYPEDTLIAYGILPWHIYKSYFKLKDAFLIKDPEQILRASADLGHYLADANVPLHTTENYNGQKTGQEGIHAFWESRLPELFSNDYDFFVGKATHLRNPQLEAWNVIIKAHAEVDSVLLLEKRLAIKFGERKYSFETKGKQTVKVYSQEYAKAYHELMSNMVEKQMRSSIKIIGDFWYTAWVDAGQPDLKSLINYKPSEEELKRNREQLEQWKKQTLKIRIHE